MSRRKPAPVTPAAAPAVDAPVAPAPPTNDQIVNALAQRLADLHRFLPPSLVAPITNDNAALLGLIAQRLGVSGG